MGVFKTLLGSCVSCRGVRHEVTADACKWRGLSSDDEFLGHVLLNASGARTCACAKLGLYFYEKLAAYSSSICSLERQQFLHLKSTAITKCWSLQEVLRSQSGRGWLLRLQHAGHLEALFDEVMAELQPMLEAGGVTMSKADRDAWAAGKAELRQLSVAMAQLCTPSALQQLAGDAIQQEAFLAALLPHLHCRADETRANLREEVQRELEFALSQVVVGPHLAIRHSDMRLFWFLHYPSTGEVPWPSFWHDFAAFLGSPAGQACEELGSVAALQEIATSEQRVVLEAAITHRSHSSVSVQQLDAAIIPSMSVEANFLYVARLYEVQQQSVSSLRAPSHSSAAGSGFAQAMQHSAEQDDAARYRTPSQAGHSSPAELEDADCVVDAAGASLTAVRLIGRDADLSRLETCARSGGMRVMVLRGPQGVGKSALASVLALRLIGGDDWVTVRTADWRHVRTLDGAALALCAALAVPAPAVPGHAGCRQLDAYLQAAGHQLHGGLIVENVEALLCARPTDSGTSAQGAAPQVPVGAVLRMLCDLAASTPHLQLVLTAASWDSSHTEALAAAIHAASPAGSSTQVSSRSMQQVEPVVVHQVQPLSQEAAMQLLLLHTGQQLPVQEAASICAACGGLPAVIRLVGSVLRQGVLGASEVEAAATECEGQAGSSSQPSQRRGRAASPAAGVHTPHTQQFVTKILRHVFTSLRPEQQVALQILCHIKVPLGQDDIDMLLQPLSHPCAVRAHLCKFYQLGLCHFCDQAQVHEVDSGVQQYVKTYMAAQDRKAAPDAQSSAASQRAARKSSVKGANGTAGVSLAAARVGTFLQACENVMDETLALYQMSGGRQAAIRLYSNHRRLVEHGLLAVGEWLLAYARASPEAEQYLQLLARHLNDTARICMGPSQLMMFGSLVQQLAPFQPDAFVRATALITAARVMAFHEHMIQDAEAMLVEAQALVHPDGDHTFGLHPPGSSPLRDLSGRLAGLFTAPASSGASSVAGQPQGPHQQTAVQHMADDLTLEEMLLLAKAEVAQAQGSDLSAAVQHLETLIASMRERRTARSTLSCAQLMMTLGDVSCKLAARATVAAHHAHKGPQPGTDADPSQSTPDYGQVDSNKHPTAASWYRTAALAYAQAYVSLGKLFRGDSHWLSARAKLRWAVAHAHASPMPQLRPGSWGSNAQLPVRPASTSCQSSTDGAKKRVAPPDVEACVSECLQIHSTTQGSFNEDVAECHSSLGTFLATHAASQTSSPIRIEAGAGTSSPGPPCSSPLQERRAAASKLQNPHANPEPRLLFERAVDSHKTACNIVLDILGDLSPLTVSTLDSFAATLLAVPGHRHAARALKHHATQLSMQLAATKSHALSDSGEQQQGMCNTKGTAALLADLLRPGAVPYDVGMSGSPVSPRPPCGRSPLRSEGGNSCTSPTLPAPPQGGHSTQSPASPTIPMPPHMHAPAPLPPALTALGAPSPDAKAAVASAANLNSGRASSSQLTDGRPASSSSIGRSRRVSSTMKAGGLDGPTPNGAGRSSTSALPAAGGSISARNSTSSLPGSSSSITDHVARAPVPVLAPVLEAMKTSGPGHTTPEQRGRESSLMLRLPMPDEGMMAANPLFNASPSLRVMDEAFNEACDEGARGQELDLEDGRGSGE